VIVAERREPGSRVAARVTRLLESPTGGHSAQALVLNKVEEDHPALEEKRV
jgi:hypothetical protein